MCHIISNTILINIAIIGLVILYKVVVDVGNTVQSCIGRW